MKKRAVVLIFAIHILVIYQHAQKNICINQQNYTFLSNFPALHYPECSPLLKYP